MEATATPYRIELNLVTFLLGSFVMFILENGYE